MDRGSALDEPAGQGYAPRMPTDPNDVDALIENLADAFGKAVVKGAKVRVDEEGAMVVTHEGVVRVRVLPTGEVIDPA